MASSNTDKIIKDTLDKFDASWRYAQTGYHSRWDRYQKLYDNERVDVGYEGITNTFVPMVYSTTEAITAALGVGRPSTDFVPQDMWQYAKVEANTEKKPDLKALNALYDYYWDCDNWDLKSIKTIRTGVKLGTSCEYIYWDIDKPRLINLPVRDLIVDPNITDPMQLITNPNETYAGRRYFTTKKALRSVKVVDPDTQELKRRYQRIGSIKGPVADDKQSDKQVKDQRVGSLPSMDDQVEVIEIWTGDRVRSIANREVLIEDADNPYKMQHELLLAQQYLEELDETATEADFADAQTRAKNEAVGLIPIGIHRFIADESQIYGKSVIDAITKPQELLNDITNQSVDAVTDVLNPQYELDPAYQDWITQITSAPGTVYPFKPGSLTAIQKPAVQNSAFNERLNIKNEIREATAADQVVKGVSSDQQQTATEVKAQLNQAGQRFDIYVRMLEREAFYQRAKIVYRMIRLFVQQPVSVPTSTPDGTKFYNFLPTQFSDDYEPQIRLEANVQSQKRQEQESSTQAYQVIIADPTNNLYQAKKILYPKMFDLSEEELDRIIGQEDQFNQMQGMGGTQPMVSPMSQEQMQ